MNYAVTSAVGDLHEALRILDGLKWGNPSAMGVTIGEARALIRMAIRTLGGRV